LSTPFGRHRDSPSGTPILDRKRSRSLRLGSGGCAIHCTLPLLGTNTKTGTRTVPVFVGQRTPKVLRSSRGYLSARDDVPIYEGRSKFGFCPLVGYRLGSNKPLARRPRTRSCRSQEVGFLFLQSHNFSRYGKLLCDARRASGGVDGSPTVNPLRSPRRPLGPPGWRRGRPGYGRRRAASCRCWRCGFGRSSPRWTGRGLSACCPGRGRGRL
jgi:hypothetical protein